MTVYNNALQTETSTKAINIGKAANEIRKALLTVTHPHILGVALSMQHWDFHNEGWRLVLYRLHPDLNTVAYLANFLC